MKKGRSDMAMSDVLVLALCAGLALSATAGVEDGCHPWSHLDYQDEAEDFRFAVVPDRSGGDFRGAFTNAMRCLNLMHPAFVMSVGDLIEGFATTEKGVSGQQSELTNFVSHVKAPFFYCVGNHDINVALPDWPDLYRLTSGVWHKFFGEKSYYSFTYKGCLFIVLDTMEIRDRIGVPTGMSPRQLDWVRETLTRNADVRWTFFFMHMPGEWNTEGWKALENGELLHRRYSVFAGHTHTYMYARRNGHDYYVLATVGGVGEEGYAAVKGQKPWPTGLKGPEYGEMDHITWVTMTKDGPIVVNLKLDGIIPGDYLNRATSKNTTWPEDMDVPPDPKALERCREIKAGK